VSAAADLARLELLADLAPRDLETLAQVVEVQSLGAGEVLCLEGSEADGAILLVDGALDCARDGEGDLGRVEAPAALGLAALAATGDREATLKAVVPSRVLLLTRNGFHRFSQDAPGAAARMLEAVVRDLATALRGSAHALLPPRG
jgi:CRP-like cAMP-binding protein